MCHLRFYYESAASPAPFTEAQLVQLRKSSLARVTTETKIEIIFDRGDE